MADRRIIVVGAGITGLTTAHRLLTDLPDVDLVVLEAGASPGGLIRTSPFAGLPVDEAADSFLVRVPWALDLCTELGLDDELVAPHARTATVWLDGTHRPLPSPNVLGIPLDPNSVEEGLLPPEDLERLTGAGLPDAPLPDGDLTVGQVVRSCVGDAVFERLIDVLLGGVNAGRADDMSCGVMAPQLLAAARSPEGLLTALRSIHAQADPAAPVFNAHPSGMGHLVDTLAGRLGNRLRLRSRVTGLGRSDAGWLVGTTGGVELADAVVLAVPAFVAADLLTPVQAEAADHLARVPYASVSLAAFAYRHHDLEVPGDQSGFLVPRDAGLFMTACSYAGSKWAHLGTGDRVLLRVSAGRFDDLRHAEMDDGALERALADDLAETLGVEAPPDAVRVSRWPRSLPQFAPGHADRMAAIDDRLAAAAPGITVAGAFRHGVGIPACIRSGNEAAAAVGHTA
ncbi:MAG: protoporphyrinogen oxidase [Actinobacteria bacterium]|nr:protoporphyrinogen oxidase [Actinomycetota bacterium]